MPIHGKQIAEKSIKPGKFDTEGYTPSGSTDLVTVEYLTAYSSQKEFQIPASIINVDPEFVELGINHEINIEAGLNSNGEEVTFSDVTLKRGSTLLPIEVVENSILYTDTVAGKTVEGFVSYALDAKWSGNDLSGQTLPTVSKPVNYIAPCLFGDSPDSNLGLTTIYNVLKTSRNIFADNIIRLEVSTSDGDYIYLVIPSNKSIKAIVDLIDNTNIPKEVFTEISTGSLSIPAGDGVNVTYSYGVKILRTQKLGSATINWNIITE